MRADVNAILFDEPLTVIDPHMKWQLRSQLKQLHREFGHTMVYVTHDQTEALTFADKVVVMYEGEVVQIGTPEELFERPNHTFVGYFIGSPGMNRPALQDRERRGHRRQRAHRGSGRSPRHPPAGQTTELGISPEFVQHRPPRRGPADHRQQGRGHRSREHRPGHARRQSPERDPQRRIGPCLPRRTSASTPEALNLYADDWRVERG